MIDEIDILDPIEIDEADEFPLAIDEQQLLAQCEETIKHGIATFLEVGEALAKIRAGKLYRQHYKTWEEYCMDRWGIGRARAYQLINSAQVAAELSTVVDKPPKNEREAREIAKSAPADRPKVIERADALAGDGPRTAKHIAQAAVELSLPVEFAIVQRRMEKYGITLTFKDGFFSMQFAGKSVGISTPTWGNVISRLEKLEEQDEYDEAHPAQVAARTDPQDAPDHGPADNAASYRARESRDAGRIERARTHLERHDYAAARAELDQVEVSTLARDRMLATIPTGRQITLGLSHDDCAALLKEARMFSGSELTKRLPAIGQVLVLLVEAIRGAA